MHFVLSLGTLQITICLFFPGIMCFILTIGASSSCQIFNRVSEALQWVMQSSYNASAMSPILNDFFFIGPADSQSCKNDLTNFLSHCKTIGVPIKMSKIQTPTTSIIFMSLKLTHAKWKHVFLLKKLIRLENIFQTCNEKAKQIYVSCNL